MWGPFSDALLSRLIVISKTWFTVLTIDMMQKVMQGAGLAGIALQFMMAQG